MKNTRVSLKKIHFSEQMSQETNAFTADVYLDGKKMGYATNNGCGGETDVNRYPDKLNELKEAEEYAKTLDPYTWEFRGKVSSIPMNLTILVDQLFEEWLDAKQKVKFKKKMEKEMKSKIIVGRPNNNGRYRTYGVRGVADLSKLPLSTLTSWVKQAKSKLGVGEVILNTNLKELGIVEV